MHYELTPLGEKYPQYSYCKSKTIERITETSQSAEYLFLCPLWNIELNYNRKKIIDFRGQMMLEQRTRKHFFITDHDMC